MSSLVFRTVPTATRPMGVSCRLVHLNGGWRYCLYDRAAHEYVGATEGYATEGEAHAAASSL